ncbi:uncharacterized protein [Amphiura filiformis]|uniref:uncharacterized protein n=1 Tax=Amphiura filiformis TaxID=82378 RepID=UPI003B22021D
MCVATDVCVCPDGFSGNLCQTVDSNLGVAVCDGVNGCQNGGVCIAADVCVCLEGFSGIFCQTTDPVCDGVNGCQNEGMCVATDVCVCPDGFSGNLCQTVDSNLGVAVCDGVNGCQNGGVCIAADVCVCLEGFSGIFCQTTDPVCDGVNGCQNEGMCVATDVCVCPDGFSGNLCQTVDSNLGVAVCDGVNGCQNGGKCIATDCCVCLEGFSGTFCQTADPVTWFYLDSPEYFVTEDGGSVPLRVHRRGVLSGSPTVTFTASDRSAFSTEDFGSFSSGGMVTFAGLSTTETITLGIINDELGEKTEQLEIRISVSAPGSSLGELYKATVTIADDDINSDAGSTGLFAFYALQKGLYHVRESQTAVSIGVVRYGDLSIAGTVDINSFDVSAKAGTHYEGLPDDGTTSTVQFGISNNLRYVTVDLPANLNVDRDRYFEVCLSDPTQGQLGAGQCASVLITNTDSEYGFRQQMYFTSAADSFVTVDVTRVGNTDDNGRVELSTQDGTAITGINYMSLSNYGVAFAAGDNVNSVRIDLSSVSSDKTFSSFKVCLMNPTAGVIAAVDCTVVVIEGGDSSISEVSFCPDTYGVKEGDNTLNVTLIRKGYVGNAVRVEVFTCDVTALEGEDYTKQNRFLNFIEGERSVNFQLVVSDDLLIEGIETLQLKMRNLTGTTLGKPNVATIFLEDDDVQYSFVTSVIIDESMNGSAIITILRQGYLGRRTMISFSTADDTAESGTDYKSVTMQVIFDVNQSHKQVEVDIIDDVVGELTEHFQVSLTPEESCIVCTASVTILDNDDIDINECEIVPPVCADDFECVNLIGSLAVPGGFECDCSWPGVLIPGGTRTICRRDVSEVPGTFAIVGYNGATANLANDKCIFRDSGSNEFRYWADVVEPECIDIYARAYGDRFVTCFLTKICPGSVVFYYDVVFEEGLAPTRNEIMDILYDRVDGDFFLQESTLKLVPSEVPCPRSYCRNGGTCYGNSTVYRCTCVSGYAGDRCESKSDQGAEMSMIIVWSLVAFDILLMLMLLALSICGLWMCLRVRKRLHRKEPSISAIRFNRSIPGWSNTQSTISQASPNFRSLQIMAKEDMELPVRESMSTHYDYRDDGSELF